MYFLESWTSQFSGALRLYAIFVACGLVIFVFLTRKDGSKFSWTGALRYLFPAEIYRHRSFRLDCWMFLLNLIVLPAAGFVGLLLTALPIQNGLVEIFGRSPLAIPDGSVAVVLQFLIIFMAQDFAHYLWHYLDHKVPLLWRLHRAHHSAEVLTPLTGSRFHPIDWVWHFALSALCTGVISGTLLYVTGMKLSPAAAALAASATVVLRILDSFSHSHVWVSYGPVLNRILLSPCMHLIHHSVLPRHRDKNLGVIFAFWDHLFGTLYVPKGREQFEFGIDAAELGVKNPHPNFGTILLEPISTATRMLLPANKQSTGRQASNWYQANDSR